MRKSFAALALITRHLPEGIRWLAHWNQHWRAYHFVGGHKHDDETFRECLIREVHEELGLVNESDFAVAASPTSRQQYTAWSERAHQDTEYTIELFEVSFEERIHTEQVLETGENRWLSTSRGLASFSAPAS